MKGRKFPPKIITKIAVINFKLNNNFAGLQQYSMYIKRTVTKLFCIKFFILDGEHLTCIN